ncbi:MAG TPA: LptA/OstA family protein [Vicinamibacterales bacterium]
MRWQRRARIVLVIVALATVAGVLATMRKRDDTGGSASVERLDPRAVAEATGGRTTRASGAEIPGFVDFEHMLTYDDGSVRFVKPKLTNTRSGRGEVLEGDEATVGPNQSHFVVTGNVVLTTADGLRATTQEATYSSAEEVVRAPGRVDFSKGATSGSGLGMSYDQRRDVLWLLKDANIAVAPQAGDPGMRIEAGAAAFARRDNYMRFEKGFTARRAGRVIRAESALAHLTEGQALRALELRERSGIVMEAAASGALQAMDARDMNLTFAEDGETLQHAVLAGRAVLQFAGQGGAPGRRIAADLIALDLGPDGEVTALAARRDVELSLPAAGDAPARTIRAERMQGAGEAGRGLTEARFTDRVEFREQVAPDRVRTATARALDVVLAADGGVETARFSGRTVFEDGALTARAPRAEYQIGTGRLQLTGEAQTRPQVQDARIFVEAVDIALTFDGPRMTATGSVQSVMKPAPRGDAKTADGPRVPGMLKDDQPANVTAATLEYDGGKGHAVYTGGSRLWQGDTAISAERITIDEGTGDLLASGGVRSTLVLDQRDTKTNGRRQVHTLASAQDLHYEEALRRATYTTNAHVNGPHGDLRAVKIEMYLLEGGGSLERVEAYDNVSVKAENRTATGARLTYFAEEEKYVMTGQVRTVADCRESTGKSLTFYRATDNVLMDGEQQQRTLSTSGGPCEPATPE